MPRERGDDVAGGSLREANDGSAAAAFRQRLAQLVIRQKVNATSSGKEQFHLITSGKTRIINALIDSALLVIFCTSKAMSLMSDPHDCRSGSG